MQLLIFDWEEGGHHPVYLDRVARALSPGIEVAVAAPSNVLAQLDGAIGAELIDLGESRPEKDSIKTRPGLDIRELDLLERSVRAAGATHAFHLFADHLLPLLSVHRRLAVPLSMLLLRPRLHYADLGATLSSRERMTGSLYELLLRRFRRRRDAGAVFTLDPVAAEGWARQGGAAAHWLPEPWVEPAPAPTAPRDGCVLYGYLSHRKGIDRLARAVELLNPGLRVVIAGEVEDGYAEELARLCASMSAAGARVERLGRIEEADAPAILSSARVALLPYRRHVGMSRVLIEAAAAGTPVIADRFGLLGRLTVEWHLGEVVDTGDPEAFAGALRGIGGEAPDDESLRRKAEELTGRQALERALAKVFVPEGPGPPCEPPKMNVSSTPS